LWSHTKAKRVSRRLRRPVWTINESPFRLGAHSRILRQAFERIAKRRGRQVAKVAAGRKILTCFYGLRDGEIRCLAPRAGARTVRTPAVTS
jgi:hypothetical protein